MASSPAWRAAARSIGIGGAVMLGHAGSMDNGAMEARADVLTFTSAPLASALEIFGPVSVQLRIRASNPGHDVFVRLCDVDPRGHSRNFCDGLIRRQPGDLSTDETTITVPMSDTAYKFSAGHRIRLQISGGAHPRFARNTGTTEPLATTIRLAPTDIAILHHADAPCTLTLPVANESAHPKLPTWPSAR